MRVCPVSPKEAFVTPQNAQGSWVLDPSCLSQILLNLLKALIQAPTKRTLSHLYMLGMPVTIK